MRAVARCGWITGAVTAALICDLVIVLSFLPRANAQRGGTGHGLGWQTFQVKEFGTTVDYPAIIFSEPAGEAEKGTGQRFNSADGRSTLRFTPLRMPNATRRQAISERIYARRALRSATNALRGPFSPSRGRGRELCSTAAATSRAEVRSIASISSIRRM
jgi:hypothetical protein